MLQFLLEESARRWPDKIALVADGQRLSYAQLDRAANCFARSLRAFGVGRGVHVAVCVENGVEGVVALFGTLKAGAVAMMLHPSVKAAKLGALLDHAESSMLVIGRARLDDAHEWGGKRRSLRTVVVCGRVIDGAAVSLHTLAAPTLVEWERCCSGDDPTCPTPSLGTNDDDVALLLYTSGSSGQPKGVMLTHHGVIAATQSIVTYLGLRFDDVILQVLPLSFGYGITQLLTTFHVGGTLVLERSFAFPQYTLTRLAETRATGFAMVPTIGALLAPLDFSAYDLSALRTVTNAGAALSPAVALQLAEKLPHARLVLMYGQTECMRASFLPPEELPRRPRSVGRGIPGQEHWLVDEHRRRLPPGSLGELVVQGPHVMRGYWKMPEETAQKLLDCGNPRERILFTGDLFFMDDEGWLTFIGRKDDVIKTRGEKVSPREVEDVLHALDGVAEAAVVGVPDAVLGELVRAFVVPRPGMLIDEKIVQRHCAAQLESYAVPRIVDVLSALPRTPNGKVDKQSLRHFTRPVARIVRGDRTA